MGRQQAYNATELNHATDCFMNVLRTPDHCFDNLLEYPFKPHYTEVSDGQGGQLRLHYLDEGAPDGELILCLHGQPSWSYLYRNMVPLFTQAGYRVICPDFIGFGKSDKPDAIEDYSYQAHVDWMSEWLQALDLQNITLICQDWGGLVGLRLVGRHPERFARLVIANTGLPDGRMPDSGEEIPLEMAPVMREIYAQIPVVEVEELGEKFRSKDGPPGFFYWRKFTAENPRFNVRDLMQSSLNLEGKANSEGILDAYNAPFPDRSYMAGARAFPSLVPIFPDDPAIPANREAWQVLQQFDRPVLTAFSDNDPVTAGGEKRFQAEVPGAQGVSHVTIANAGHFLQEEQTEELTRQVLTFMQHHPLAG